jgi:N-acetylmuramoyl-L-alanine amidase
MVCRRGHRIKSDEGKRLLKSRRILILASVVALSVAGIVLGWSVTSGSNPTHSIAAHPRHKLVTPKSQLPQLAILSAVAGKTIVLDPGHNGLNGEHTAEINQPVDAGGFQKPCDTTGTQTDSGYTESAFNLAVATDTANLLRGAGATVVLTRQDDNGWGPCVNQRAAIGNSLHAAVAVSIHADGGPVDGRGFQILEPALLPAYTSAIYARSIQLGSDLRRTYAAVTGMPPSTYAGTDGIELRTDLGGLNLSTVPKVFVECGNMRNATDAALLVTPTFQQQAALGIAEGIAAFLGGS